MHKILIVDDEEAARIMTCKMVERMGYIGFKTSDAQRAWEILEDNSDISCVITDRMMPDITGDELAQKLRDSERFSEIPIIMVSAYVTVKDTAQLLESGISAIIPKPLSKDALEEHLNRYLKK
ncbi:MAG: response regulator [Candidatus Cloacimonadota bacterium]|nr:MAG: response regulator [Candidatus Cloacimonadota bacterium]